MNRIWLILLLFTLFCQRNTPDADELLPVTTIAVQQEAGAYRLLLEGARQSSLEGSAEAVYLSVSADSADALFAEAQEVFAEHLTFMHTSLLLVDPALQPHEIRGLCTALLDKQGAPRTAYLACAANKTPEELLRHEHPVEEIPGLGLRDLLRAEELQAETPLPTLADGRALSSHSPRPLPGLRLTGEDQILCGGAILPGEKGGAS
ncbi:MAG: hypothetical protein IKM54_06515 [Butyricicoccus sp.]|nr:hypothetical protein [Butyricicoccus sp.]